MNGLAAALILLVTSTAAGAAVDQPTESVLAQSINIAAGELGAKGACLNENPLAITTESSGADPIASLLASVPPDPGTVAPAVWSLSQTRKTLRSIRKGGLYSGLPLAATNPKCRTTISIEPPRASKNAFAVRVALRVNSSIIQRAYLFTNQGNHVKVVAKTPEEIIVS